MKKKEHFIQEAFIKDFSTDRYVFVFNKVQKKMYKSHTHDVFEINKFFNIPVDYAYNKMNEEEKADFDDFIKTRYGIAYCKLTKEDKNKISESFEDYRGGELETNMPKLIKNLKSCVGDFLSGLGINQFTPKLKGDLSVLISYFYFRTRSYKNLLVKTFIKSYRSLNEQGEIEISKEQSNVLHIKAILNSEFTNRTAFDLFNKKWTIVINKTKKPFVFIDKVLCFNMDKEKLGYKSIRLDSDGLDILFPVSPYILIRMYNSNDDYYSYSVVKSEAGVDEINRLLISQADREFICGDGEYMNELIEKFKLIY